MFSPDIITCLDCGSTDMNCEFKVAVVPKAQSNSSIDQLAQDERPPV